jgi:hypothetical protein
VRVRVWAACARAMCFASDLRLCDPFLSVFELALVLLGSPLLVSPSLLCLGGYGERACSF